MGKLTARKVETLTDPGRYSDDDGSGFHLRITADGGKYYVLRATVDGQRKDISLGSAKRITLALARDKARRLREEIEANGAVAHRIPTFAEAVVSAHGARTAGFKNDKHVAQWKTTLETYAVPLIGDKLIDKVERADVVKILTPIWLTKPETAGRVLQRIDRVMRWAVGNDHRKDRIDMTLVRDALPPLKRRRSDIKRMASVGWEDAPAFWASIPLSRSAPEIRLGLSLLILTAVRPGNIATAHRDQFDLDRAIWTIPAAQMKTNEVLRVPLSPPATALVRAILASDADLLFAVRGEPISPDTLRMMMRRMGRAETPHGFRSTFKDWSRSAGWADHLSEAALGHADPNEVRAAYARSDLLEERRPMMAAWAAYLAGSGHTSATHQPG